MKKPNPDDRGKAKLEGNDDETGTDDAPSAASEPHPFHLFSVNPSPYTSTNDAPSAAAELHSFSLFSVDPHTYFVPAGYQVPWKTQTPLTSEQISKDEQTERIHLPPAESSTERSVSQLGTKGQKYSAQEFGASSSSQMEQELQQDEPLPGYGAPSGGTASKELMSLRPQQASGADDPPPPQLMNNDTNFPQLTASRVANPELPALNFLQAATRVPPPAATRGRRGRRSTSSTTRFTADGWELAPPPPGSW